MVGTGLSIAIEHIAVGKANNVMSQPKLDTGFSEELKKAAEAVAQKNNRGEANIEDYIRVINELIKGLEILGYNTTKDADNKHHMINLKIILK